MTDWTEDVPITDVRVLPPDPRLMDAIGLNHALESAVADLVDNSIDAKAEKVLVRFVRDGAKLLAIVVVDDGIGMDEETIDVAMTIGGAKDYETGSLGHFGMGLKAASLGQAKSLTVGSRAAGSVAVGRRWLIQKATRSFECDVVDPSFVDAELERDWGPVSPSTGTIVRWDDVKDFPHSSNNAVTNRYLEDALLRIRRHLGLVFHRILEHGRVAIALDVEDVSAGESVAPFFVGPIDPFSYLRTGRQGYPKTLPVAIGDSTIDLACHIWPGRSQLPGFKLAGGPVESRQGFYFYRNDRLLQAGGWNGVVHGERHYQLGRVVVDLRDAATSFFHMNPEKTKVEVHGEFADVVEEAKGRGGFTLARYLEDATATFKDSRKRKRQRPQVIPPGKGFTPRVRKAIANELDFLAGEEPFDIRWAPFGDESFFLLDREDRVIWLNNQYRQALVGSGGLNDAPVIKALLYLLMEDLFRGAFLGAKDKDLLELYDAVLTAAAESELE